VAGLDEVEGHRPSHVPEPDEADAHEILLEDGVQCRRLTGGVP
jgi:hypothetical protein